MEECLNSANRGLLPESGLGARRKQAQTSGFPVTPASRGNKTCPLLKVSKIRRKRIPPWMQAGLQARFWPESFTDG